MIAEVQLCSWDKNFEVKTFVVIQIFTKILSLEFLGYTLYYNEV